MSFEGETADLHPGRVMCLLDIGGGQGTLRLSVRFKVQVKADEVEDVGIAVKRLGCPILGDFGEQSVL